MTLAEPVHRRVVLDNVSWESYRKLRAEVGGNVRLTFDEGRLEIMSPSPLHEKVKKLIARLIEAYGDALEIAVEGFGSTTFDPEELKKGLEPDECYYVQHAEDVSHKTELDLKLDPPPDLAIEIDISPPGLAREPIYAALGVPEIWRFDGERVTSLHRTRKGDYRSAGTSLAFPDLPMEQLNRFVALGLTSGQFAAVKALREWVRTMKRPGRKKK